jgi:hypothetical protein
MSEHDHRKPYPGDGGQTFTAMYQGAVGQFSGSPLLLGGVEDRGPYSSSRELRLKAGDRVITDWRRWPHPKRAYQWRSGRSAMELARAWFTSRTATCPPEVMALCDSHPLTSGTCLVEGRPEHVTALPERGEGRNHDLLVFGRREGRDVVISVEAKVDEPFGEPIGEYWARKRRTSKPTRAPERIEALLAMVFGSEARPDAEPWRGLRYQLLTAVAGTALEAARREADTAVVIIHEFCTADRDTAKVARNASDLQAFMTALVCTGVDNMAPGRLYGPAVLTAGKHLHRPVNVLIGKAMFAWEWSESSP